MGAIKLIDLDTEIFVPIYDEGRGISYEQIMTVAEFFDNFMDGNMPHVIEISSELAHKLGIDPKEGA